MDMRILRASASHAVAWPYGQTDHGLTELLRRVQAGAGSPERVIPPFSPPLDPTAKTGGFLGKDIPGNIGRGFTGLRRPA
jgi:hypothetical protein